MWGKYRGRPEIVKLIEGKINGGIEVTGRRWRRRRKLLDDLKGRRGYCLLKEEALDRTVWRAGYERGFGRVVRQTAKWIKIYLLYIYNVKDKYKIWKMLYIRYFYNYRLVLCYYVASSGKLLPTYRDNVSVRPSRVKRRFGTTYVFHLRA